MSSSVHFKFKSQKEPSRVTFDGTGISVFELKREIINQNRLGDGTDFELSIYNEDTGEGLWLLLDLLIHSMFSPLLRSIHMLTFGRYRIRR